MASADFSRGYSGGKPQRTHDRRQKQRAQERLESPRTPHRPQPRTEGPPARHRPRSSIPGFQPAQQLVAEEKESILLDMGLDQLEALTKAQTPSEQLASVMFHTAQKDKKGPTVREALATAAQRAKGIERKIEEATNQAMLAATPPSDAQHARVLSHGSGMDMNRVFEKPNYHAPPTRHTVVQGDYGRKKKENDPNRKSDPSERHNRHGRAHKPAPHKQKERKKRRPKIPPPPKTPPPEYIDGYDSDESMYTPQFEGRSLRQFSMDDSSVTKLNTPMAQVKNEKSGIHRRAKTRHGSKHRQIGLPDVEGELTEKQFYQKYWIEAGKLGEGSFARVRKITRKHDRIPFALKVIKKAGKSQEDLDALQREIAILAKLDHPNVVKLTDWVYTKKRIYMIVEFCDGGDVFERILKLKTFSEFEASHVIRQVVEGLEHFHSKGIVHRDLKPDNLMYLTDDPQSAVKVIDFGLAGDASEQLLTTPCGTAHYVAPEVLLSKPYGTQADMWSLGVIIYMLLCGFPPFFDATGNQKRLYKLIKSGRFRFPSPYWDYISEQAKDLVKGLLTKDPKKRMTAAEALSHPWIGGKAKKKELSDIYMNQMKHFQSSRHFTNMKLGEEDKHKPTEPVNMFANKKYTYEWDDEN